MLQSATEHYRRQQRITAAAVAAARRRGLKPAEIAELVAGFQLLAARDALASVPEMLEEQGIEAPPNGAIAAASFAGTALDGRPLESLFQQATGIYSLLLMVTTQVQDAARTAAGVSVAARKVRYARMLNPPSCARCVILAGRLYYSIDPFLRHPGCDCRHVPSAEALADDLTTNPRAYFESMDQAGRLKFAGSKANLRAIEDGADLNQIVNAYRKSAGMQAAGESSIRSIPNRRGGIAKVTDEGTSNRGRAGIQQRGLRLGGQVDRLMPETIYKNAANPDDAIRLLKFHGWITDEAALERGRAAFAEQRRAARNAAQRRRRADRVRDRAS